ncbi:hypothetical protein Acr_00g0075710 [Actinidia rufa]|uniref:Uncharacterized protein n=1 Tax=Actinidia rufa TaxID=165716 RepID=A0A7J0DSR3_9ERIC|nr:hypothetical protein Acr_00g0075710 [Actinidia rufa]
MELGWASAGLNGQWLGLVSLQLGQGSSDGTWLGSVWTERAMAIPSYARSGSLETR